jgi:hypothetical protein
MFDGISVVDPKRPNEHVEVYRENLSAVRVIRTPIEEKPEEEPKEKANAEREEKEGTPS